MIVFHAGIASIFAAPEYNLDRDDASLLSENVANVLHEFNIPIDTKVAAIVGLVLATGKVYGPKVGLTFMRLQDEKKRKAVQQPLKVV